MFLGGEGYPGGPKRSALYAIGKGSGILRPLEFWTLMTSGVEVKASRWVNMFGFTMFDGADCPRCGARRDDWCLDDVGVEEFTDSGVVPNIACPACGSASLLHEWKCDPHLGFVNLAIVFWNWPSFDNKAWKVDVPRLLGEALGRPLLATFGHL